MTFWSVRYDCVSTARLVSVGEREREGRYIDGAPTPITSPSPRAFGLYIVYRIPIVDDDPLTPQYHAL